MILITTAIATKAPAICNTDVSMSLVLKLLLDDELDEEDDEDELTVASS
jgi:hypothetical protein